MRRIGSAVLALALAGCGGSGPTAKKDLISPASSGEQMRITLGQAGLDCTDYQPKNKGYREFGTEDATDVGRCELENESIQLAVWKDKGQVDNWMGFAKTMGCALGKSFDLSSFDYVAGKNWVISNVSQTLADKIADAVGGTPHHVDMTSCAANQAPEVSPSRPSGETDSAPPTSSPEASPNTALPTRSPSGVATAEAAPPSGPVGSVAAPPESYFADVRRAFSTWNHGQGMGYNSGTTTVLTEIFYWVCQHPDIDPNVVNQQIQLQETWFNHPSLQLYEANRLRSIAMSHCLGS